MEEDLSWEVHLKSSWITPAVNASGVYHVAEEVRTLLSTCNQHFLSQTHRRRSLEILNTRSWFSDVSENMPLPKTFVSVEYVVHISHDRSHKTNVSNL